MALGFTTGGGIEALEQNDVSDLSTYKTSNTGGSAMTLVNVSGSGVFLTGHAAFANEDSTEQGAAYVNYTVDGVGPNDVSVWTGQELEGGSGDSTTHMPAVKFESSLKIVVHNPDAGRPQIAAGWLKQ